MTDIFGSLLGYQVLLMTDRFLLIYKVMGIAFRDHIPKYPSGASRGTTLSPDFRRWHLGIGC